MFQKQIVISSIVISTIFATSGYAQKNGALELYLGMSKLKYNRPVDYQEINQKIAFLRTSRDQTSLLLTVLQNENKNFVIGITMMPVMKSSKEMISLLNTFSREKFDESKSFWNRVKYEADTSVYPTLAVKEKDIRKIHADNGIVYQLRMDRKFMDSYDKCRVLTIHKADVSEAQIFFFYNKIDESKVNREIKKCFKILTYNSD